VFLPCILHKSRACSATGGGGAGLNTLSDFRGKLPIRSYSILPLGVFAFAMRTRLFKKSGWRTTQTSTPKLQISRVRRQPFCTEFKNGSDSVYSAVRLALEYESTTTVSVCCAFLETPKSHTFARPLISHLNILPLSTDETDAFCRIFPCTSQDVNDDPSFMPCFEN